MGVGGESGNSSFGYDYVRARENSTSTSKNLDSQLTADISTSKMHKFIRVQNNKVGNKANFSPE